MIERPKRMIVLSTCHPQPSIRKGIVRERDSTAGLMSGGVHGCAIAALVAERLTDWGRACMQRTVAAAVAAAGNGALIVHWT